MSADASAHLRPGIADAPVRTRPAAPARLNLKSNELLHPDAHQLTRAALDRLATAAVVSYPHYAPAEHAVAAYHGIAPEQVLLTGGSDHAIGIIVAALAATTGRLVLPDPDYEAWTEYATIHRVSTTQVAIEPDDHPAGLGKRLLGAAAAPSVLALSSPNGHTGRAVPPSDLTSLAGDAGRHGHLLVVDTCYHAFDPDPAAAGIIAALAANPHAVVVNSYSKSHGLAGARIASVTAAPQVIAYLRRWRPDSSLSGIATALLLDRLADPAAAAIIADVRRWRGELAAAITARCPGWRCPDTATNFLTIATGSLQQAANLASRLTATGVRVRAYDHAGWRDRIRLTVAPPAHTAEILRICAEVAAS